MPYQDFINSQLNATQTTETTVPNSIVNRVFDEGITPMRAWREHLGFTQAEVAERAGTSQASYAQTENRQRPRKAPCAKWQRLWGWRLSSWIFEWCDDKQTKQVYTFQQITKFVNRGIP